MNEFYADNEYEQRIRDLQLALDGAMKKLATVEAERDKAQESVVDLHAAKEALRTRAEHAERILAARREASEGICKSCGGSGFRIDSKRSDVGTVVGVKCECGSVAYITNGEPVTAAEREVQP